MTRAGCRATRSPTRLQKPWVASRGLLEPEAAHLVGREDRAVERADDQRRDAAGR